MSCNRVFDGGNRENEGGCKGENGGRVGRFDRYFFRVKSTAYGEETTISESENRGLNGGISI